MDLPLVPDQEIAKMIIKVGLPLLFQYITNKDKINIELEEPLKIWFESVTTDDVSDVKSRIMNDLKLARREIESIQYNILKLKNERKDVNSRIDATQEEYEELKIKYDAAAEDWQKAADELHEQHDERKAELIHKKETMDRDIERMRREFDNECTGFEAEVQEDITDLSKRHEYEDLYHQNELLLRKTAYNKHLLSISNIDAEMEKLKISLETSTQKRKNLVLNGQALATFGAGPLDAKCSDFVLKHEPKEQVSEWINDTKKKMIAEMNGNQLDKIFLALKNLKLHENCSFGSCTSDQEVGKRIRKEVLSERKIRALKVCTQGGNIESNSEEVLEVFSRFIEEVEPKKKKRTSLFGPARYIARTPAKLPSLKMKREREEESTPMRKRRFNTRTSTQTPIRNLVRTPIQNTPLSLKQAPSSSISRLSLSQCSLGEVPVSDLSFHE